MALRPSTAITSQEQHLTMSYEEFLAWSSEDTHAEWVEGEVIVFVPPKTIHQQIVGFLHNLLSLYANLFQLGVVLTDPFEMRIRDGKSSREPDLLFIAQEHLERLTPEHLEGPADLVIEIVSDESVARDRTDKFYEYQEAGVREYWIIDPRPGTVRVDFYHLTTAGQFQATLPDNEGRYYAAVLPDFWFRPDWLQQEPLPDPLTTLAEIAPQALREAVGGNK